MSPTEVTLAPSGAQRKPLRLLKGVDLAVRALTVLRGSYDEALDWYRKGPPATAPSTTRPRRLQSSLEVCLAPENMDEPRAFVPGYDYDVFLSYAHVDDLTPAGEPGGWVTELHRRLAVLLAQRFGRADSLLLGVLVEELKLVAQPRPSHLTPVGGYRFPKARKYEKLERPRPAGTSFVEWILENVE